MKFQKHSSTELTALFHDRPFQGQSPEQASIIFLSSDANYSPEISNHPFFEHILAYHADGVAFWKQHGCHHPFLLPDYPFKRNAGGVPFHRNFSKLGLGPEYAGHISFLELLDIPTIGNKSQGRIEYAEMLSSGHLAYLARLITGGGHKLFFVSSGVLKDLRRIQRSHPHFPWLDGDGGPGGRFTRSVQGNTIAEIYHFSSSRIHGQLNQIRKDIDSWLA